MLDDSDKVIRRLSSKLEPRYIAPDHPDVELNEDRKPDLEAVAGMNRAA